MKRIKDYRQYAIRGLVYEQSDINKVAMYPTESFKHFMAKCCLVYLLRKLGHDVITEIEITGCGIGDILDLTTKVQYEIELDKSKQVRNSKIDLYRRTGTEIIIVDCHSMPIDIKELAKFLDPYIVPD